MNFMESVKTCFQKYVDVNGRASRSEYWWFVLFCVIVNLVTYPIHPMVNGLAALILLCPSVAVLVRRLHDDDMSGWWALLALVPLVGLVLIYFAVIPGTAGPNRFGNPVV